ncbi:hypothetical protein [Rodentibacter caecimuris]|uniref:hypothetical protein n=1 Tax=Rodentibacter caecimuris TaxID=1796644 RepID=UPI0013A0A287|nr:hypothetical protein [Rodentibacter heylii]QIA77384.1 hypothetical protein FEE42_08505 [Rodentibacter heylii]
MSVIILDRNVINLIKEVNSGKIITDSNKLDMLQQLQNLDLPQNRISPIFSIIEGQKGRIENFQEKRDTAKIETTELEVFFKNATVDKYPMDNIGSLYASLDVDRSYLDTKIAIGKFLKRASNLLRAPVSETNREKIANDLIVLARECKISSHEGGKFALLLGFLCLYRDNNALKIIKFKKAKKMNLYNALSDIFHFINFIKIKAYLAAFHSSTHIKFITLDKPLDSLFSYIGEVSKRDIADQNLVGYKLVFSEKLTSILPNNILEKLQQYER